MPTLDAAPRSKTRRWIPFLLVPVVLIAGLAACETLGWPFLREPAETLLNRKMGREVRLAPPFRLHLLGAVRLQLGGLWIAAPAGFKVPHLVDAQGIRLTFRYRDLLAFRESGQLRIESIVVDQLDARLIRLPDGHSTWQIGEPRSGEPSAPLPVVNRMDVKQGTLVIRDPLTSTDLDASFDTREGASNTAPTSHAQAQGTIRLRPFKGQLTTGGFLPMGTGQASGAPVAAKGWLEYSGIRVDFDGSVTDLAGKRNLKGAVRVKGPSLAVLGRLINSPLPTTGPFRLKGEIEKDADVWHAQVGEARIGKSDLEGRFTYDPRGLRPRLEGELKGKRFVLADLAPAFGTRSQEGVEIKPPPGRVLPNRPLDLPSLTKMDAKLAVAFDTVELGKAFSQPISPLKGVLTLDHGRLALSQIVARTAEGSLAGSFSVDGGKTPPLWQADLSWDGIRLENWLKGAKEGPAKARGKAAPAKAPPHFFTGTLHGHAKLTGHGRSTAELIGSLDGRSTVFVRHGTLSHLVVEVLGLDIAQGLGLLLRGDQPLPLECAVADLEARNGRLTPKVAVVDTPVTLVLIDGNVDLARESLALRVTAKPKNMSPFTVRSPILVHGSFAKPEAAPETGPIAARVLGAAALAFVNPLAAIVPFIDPGSSATSPCMKSLVKLGR